MELYQELFNDYLKEYYNIFEELLNCLENDDKKNFKRKLIYLYIKKIMRQNIQKIKIILKD